MRKLIVSDVPKFCRILKKLNIRDDIKTIAASTDTLNDAVALAGEVWGKGFDAFWLLMEKATEVAIESEIYAFLAGPMECEADEISKMSLPQFAESMKQLAAENDLLSFFGAAGAMMK